jgi:hypothetical protein
MPYRKHLFIRSVGKRDVPTSDKINPLHVRHFFSSRHIGQDHDGCQGRTGPASYTCGQSTHFITKLLVAIARQTVFLLSLMN